MKNNHKLYMFTDENINSMLQKLQLNGKSVLTYAGSGDQALNFILEGVNKITLFDNNRDAEYYFYLKKALIQNLSYEEFLNFFLPGLFNRKDFFDKNKYELIRKDLPSNEIRDYWDNIFNSFSKEEIKSLFVNVKYNKKDKININNYLRNEDNYNKLKEKLSEINDIDFIKINITNQIMYVDEKVDFIYLSELLNKGIKADNQIDYLKKIKALTLNISHNVKENGVIAVSYLHCYLDDHWFQFKNNMQSIISGPENTGDFLNKDCSVIDFKGGYIPNSSTMKDRDALILYDNKPKKKVRRKY